MFMRIDPRFFQLTKRLPTPSIVYDLDQVRQNYSHIQRVFPNVRIHFAVKCNAEDRILTFLESLGAGFEVASQFEAEQLIRLNIAPAKIICMHPIKSPACLQYLHAHGIRIMAVDSCEEIDKIARYAPNSRLVVRISVNNTGSLWNLNGKFGLHVTEIPQIFEHIRARNLTLYGLTFQVGSQCENPENWLRALELCRDIWRDAASAGTPLQFLSLGGGLPAPYARPIPSLTDISAPILNEIREHFAPLGNLEVAIEPGRSLVASAGILVSEVFGIATRGATRWAYIETGTYNGLIEAIETSDHNFYPVVVEHTDRPRYHYHIGGPSCVTLDTPFEDIELPELQIGDRLYILSAGAYTRVCATPFNGFPVPAAVYWQDLVAEHAAHSTPRMVQHRNDAEPQAVAEQKV